MRSASARILECDRDTPSAYTSSDSCGFACRNHDFTCENRESVCCSSSFRESPTTTTLYVKPHRRRNQKLLQAERLDAGICQIE